MAGSATTRFATTGMHCASCAMLIQMSVEDLAGVESVSVDVGTGITEVAYDPSVVTPADVISEVVKAGYGAEVAD